MRLAFAVFLLNIGIISNGGTNQHRFTILFGDNNDNVPSDVEIGRNLDTYSYTSKDINLKGSIRKYMLFEVGRTNLKVNMVCSPIAAVLALEKLGFGASGDAKDEIERAVGASFDFDVERDAKRTVRMLKNLPGVVLNFGSRIYVSHKVRLKNSYTDKVEKAFGNSVIRIDFTDRKLAAAIINSWVSSMTNRLIKTIVKPDELPRSDAMAMVIVNAIYFKGRWKHPFEPKLTKQQYFYITKEKALSVSMMKKESSFKYIYSKELDAQLILLPFHGDESAMLIILPKSMSRDRFKSLFNKLLDSPRKLASAIANMKRTRVRLSMPKFEIGITMDLGEVYKLMEVRKIFSDGGLTKIAEDDKHLAVEKAVQKIYVAVDEFGAEGAQATEIEVDKLSSHFHEQMIIDHPFAFMVLAEGEQLFSGVFTGTDEFSRV